MMVKTDVVESKNKAGSAMAKMTITKTNFN